MTISFWIFKILFSKMVEEKVEVEDLLSVGDSVFTRCEGRDYSQLCFYWNFGRVQPEN